MVLRLAMVQLKPSVICLFMNLFVLVLAAQAAEKSRPVFVDWLAQSTATGVQTARLTGAPAYGYDELEEEIGCLRTIDVDGCRNIGCNDFCQFEVGGCSECEAKKHRQVHFTCAPEEGQYKHKSDHFLGSNDLDVGYCEMVLNQFGLGNSLDVGRNVTQLGTFYATCYLNKGADLCGHPFCDDMVITVEGPYYRNILAGSHSNPADPPFCLSKQGGRADVPGSKALSWEQELGRHTLSNKKTSGKAGKPSVAQYDDNGLEGPGAHGIEVIGVGPDVPGVQYDNGPEDRIFVGDAIILSGPMRVTSRKYNLKTNQHGWFEFVYGWTPLKDENWQPVSVPASAAEGLYIVKPRMATLKFSKALGGYDKQEGPAGEEYRPVGYEEKY